MSYKRSIPSKLARRNSVGESRGIKSTFSRPLFAVRLALDPGCIVGGCGQLQNPQKSTNNVSCGEGCAPTS